MMSLQKEQIYIRNIYLLLIGLLVLYPYLQSIISTTLINTIKIIFLIYIFIYEYRLYRAGRLSLGNGFSKGLYLILLAISIGAIVRGDWPSMSSKAFYLHVLSSLSLSFIIPFIIYPLPNRKHFNEVLHCFFIGALLVIPLWVISAGELVQDAWYGESIGVYLPFFAALLLGFIPAFNKKKRFFILAIWAFYFLLMLLNARRNVSFSLAIYAFIAFMFICKDKIKRNISAVLIFVFIGLLSACFISLNWDSLTRTTFKNMSNRAADDSRSGVEELFFLDFAASPVEDWIFGRGMDGGYYQEMRDEVTGEIETNRKGIETGYLNLLLRGGLIYGAVIVLFMLDSVLRGYNKKDFVSKYLATILLTFFIDLYTTNPVSDFSVRSITFWFLISSLSKKQYL